MGGGVGILIQYLDLELQGAEPGRDRYVGRHHDIRGRLEVDFVRVPRIERALKDGDFPDPAIVHDRTGNERDEARKRVGLHARKGGVAAGEEEGELIGREDQVVGVERRGAGIVTAPVI